VDFHQNGLRNKTEGDNKMTKLLCAGLIAAMAVSTAYAQTSEQTESSQAAETTTKLKDVRKKDKTATDGSGEDTDAVITNRMQRAATGSKSKGLSFSTSLGYNMGTVEKPFAPERPNITAGTATRTVPALGGDVGVRYRVSPTANIGFGVGIMMVSPFHEGVNSLGERTFVSDPSLSLTKVYRLGGTQNVSSLGVSAHTDDQARRIGAIASPSIGHTVLYDFGGSRMTVGLSASAWGTFFNKDPKSMEMTGRGPMAIGYNQSDYNIGVYPFMEYVINDRFNFRALLGQSIQHRRSDRAGNLNEATTFRANAMYSSMGLGISITRDIFLYPNVQFIPEDIRSDRTNVAIRADINVF